MKGGKMTKRFGFTLAEVLVTLSIIGVVAAMTVPTLMNSTSTQEYSAGFKKIMSTLNQAITMQYALDGTDMREYSSISGTGAFDANNGVAGMLMNRLQVVSTTSDREVSGANTGNAAIYLSDGMVIEFPNTSFRSATCQQSSGKMQGKSVTPGDMNAAGEDECLYTIKVDVNGDKGKCTQSQQTTTANQTGKNTKVNPGDCFIVDVYPDGVRPADWVGRQLMFNAK